MAGRSHAAGHRRVNTVFGGLPPVRLAGLDPDMAVDIEHEDAAYDRLEGLALAAGDLRAAAGGL